MRRVKVRQTKIKRKEKKEKYLRKVMVKIRLKQEKEEERIVVNTLLDSGAVGFAKKHRFRRTKLKRPIYMRNINGTLN